MEIEKRHKIATLMASLAGVPGPGFAYAGYSDDQMVGELVRLQPQPALLGRYMVDLGRVHGPDRLKEFEVKLQLAVKAIPDGDAYIEIVQHAFRTLSEQLANAPSHVEMALSVPFNEDLPSINRVMGHVQADRK